MELVYVWVEEYKNIKKQGFNFTNDYEIQVNPEIDKIYHLNIKPRKRINIFNSDNNGITDIFGIIGKNGSGKTSTLNAILSHKLSGFSIYKLENNEEEKPYLVIYSDDLVINVDKDIIEIMNYNQEKRTKDFLLGINYNDILENSDNKKIVCIYYDNIFNADKTYKEIARTLFNTSKPSKNEKIKKEYEINISTSYEFFHKNSSDKLKFISNEIKNSISFFQSSIFDNPFCIQKPDKFIIKNIGKGKENFNENFVSKISDIFIEQFIKKFTNEDEGNKYLIKIKNELQDLFLKCQKGEKNEEDIKQFIIDKNESKDSRIILKYDESGIPQIPTIANFIKIIQKFWKLQNEIKEEKNSEEIRIEFSNKKVMESISEFIDFIKENTIEEHFFEYSFIKKNDNKKNDRNREYSTGELAVITFFSRFMAKYSDIKNIENNNIMVLLDEPDIFMHPEWQRIYISVLKEFFENFYKDKKVKIILTSHSPFIASDLPRENVIMLDVYDEKDVEVENGKQEAGNCKVVMDKNIKTFGANIHNLLSNSFFMKSTMGEFAKQKITDVLKDLDMEIKKEKKIDEKRKEEINYIISNIGEPIIKTKLQQMYDRAFPKDTNYLKLISDLENEIIQLTKEKENPKNGLDALKKLKGKISEYEEVLKKVGDIDDKD